MKNLLLNTDRFLFAFAIAYSIGYSGVSQLAFALALNWGFDYNGARLLGASVTLLLTFAVYCSLRRAIAGLGSGVLPYRPAPLISASALLGLLLAVAASGPAAGIDEQSPTSALYVLASGVIAPVSEEFTFREIVLCGMLPTLGLPGSIVASSMMFAFSHGNPELLPPLFAAGVLFAIVRIWSGSMASCIVLHIVANLAAIPLASMDVPIWLSAMSWAVVIALSLSFFIVEIRSRCKR